MKKINQTVVLLNWVFVILALLGLGSCLIFMTEMTILRVAGIASVLVAGYFIGFVSGFVTAQGEVE